MLFTAVSSQWFCLVQTPKHSCLKSVPKHEWKRSSHTQWILVFRRGVTALSSQILFFCFLCFCFPSGHETFSVPNGHLFPIFGAELKRYLSCNSCVPTQFCSGLAAAPGTVSAPTSLPLVPCSLNPPHQRPQYLEARATFSVPPLPRLPWRWGVTHTWGETQRTAAAWDLFVGHPVRAFSCPSRPASLSVIAVERGDHTIKSPPSEVEAGGGGGDWGGGSLDSPLARLRKGPCFYLCLRFKQNNPSSFAVHPIKNLFIISVSVKLAGRSG